jgi:hypothetical protein
MMGLPEGWVTDPDLSYLDCHILPQWEDWPLGAVFNDYLEIERWVRDLHEELAEPSVSSVFALFSTVLNVAVRARRIPANPCNGVRVSSGDYEADRQVAPPCRCCGRRCGCTTPSGGPGSCWR